MYLNTNAIPLFLNIKQKVVYFLLCFLVFILSLANEYIKYSNFTKDELYHSTFKIANIYFKTKKAKKYFILKLQNNDFHFYTSIYPKQESKYSIGEALDVFVVSRNVDFIDYLKGFYAPTTILSEYANQTITQNITSTTNIRDKIHKFINSQHNNSQIANLFSTLFLATPLNKANREFATIFHISHLLAISGFHIAFLIAIFSFFYSIVTKPIYAKFAPYRNRVFHSLLLATILSFFYLYLTNFPPSLIRAFVMFVFALVFLYSNIKVFSFFSLSVVVAFILALSPKLLFSLSFWFSVCGVFYIFLFIMYFFKLNKILFAILLNFWLFFALLAIAHFYFYHFSLYAFFAPIATLLFYVFYPFMLFLHLIGQGGILDNYIYFILMQLPSFSVQAPTPPILFYVFIAFSFLSIYSKYCFYILNMLIVYALCYFLYLLWA